MSELTAETADVAAEPVEVPVSEVVMPAWSWLLLLVPVVGWLALLMMVATRRPVRSETAVPARSLVLVGRVRYARAVVVGVALVVLAVGVVGRVVDASWAPGVLTVGLLAPVAAWFAARLVEASVVASATC